MASFFKRLFERPESPKMAIPKPEVPAIPEKESPEDIAKFMKKRRGRQSTILTGDLVPMDIGKRSLLG
jgi:hypothetical protein